MEVIIALCLGLLLGVLINRLSYGRPLKSKLKDPAGRAALLMTYALVFMIGLRVADVLPNILSGGSQVLLAILTFSAIPTVFSLVVAYVLIRS